MASRYQSLRNFQRSFSLLIFEEDFINICSLVSKCPHLEIGGNLFGLWTNNGNAVVLVATGPGKNCKRSVASFYQDIPYMARVGQLLTQRYPLCHIGEWHSHHQLQLYEPSSGDCNTITRNYPTGSQGFVLMIANIRQDGRVQLSPYKFTDEESRYQAGNIEVFDTKNPFNSAALISSEINRGKETVAAQEQQGWHSSSRQRDLQERSRPRDPSDDYRPRSRSRSPQKRHTDKQSPVGNTFSPTVTQDSPHYPPQPPIQPRINQRNRFRELHIRDTQTINTDQAVNFAHGRVVTERKRSLLADQSHRRESSTHVTPATHDNTEGVSVTAHRNGSRRSPAAGNTYNTTAIYNEQHRSISNSTRRNDVENDRSPGTGRELNPNRNSTLSNINNAPQRLANQRGNNKITRNEFGQILPAPVSCHPMSNTSSQWYEVDPAVLRETVTFMKTLANNNHVEIKRDKATKQVSFQFKHNNSQWTVYFPEMFPKEGRVQYSESIDHQAGAIELTGNIEDFKFKLKKAIQ